MWMDGSFRVLAQAVHAIRSHSMPIAISSVSGLRGNSSEWSLWMTSWLSWFCSGDRSGGKRRRLLF